MEWLKIVVLIVLGGIAVYFILDSFQAFQEFRRRKDIYFVFSEDHSRQRAREILREKAEEERQSFVRRTSRLSGPRNDHEEAPHPSRAGQPPLNAER